MVEMQTATDHARTFWPGVPLVACRRHGNGYQRLSLRNLDGATLKRLGFRAIADKAAQMPALLREIEGHGATGELKVPEIVQKPPNRLRFRCRRDSKRKGLRAAFDLVSSLHFIGDQIGAAHTALAGIEPLVSAERWTIYLDLRCQAVRGFRPGSDRGKRPRSTTGPAEDEEWRRDVHAGGRTLPRLRIQGRETGGSRHGHHQEKGARKARRGSSAHLW